MASTTVAHASSSLFTTMSVTPELPTVLGDQEALPFPDGNELFLQLQVPGFLLLPEISTVTNIHYIIA